VSGGATLCRDTEISHLLATRRTLPPRGLLAPSEHDVSARGRGSEGGDPRRARHPTDRTSGASLASAGSLGALTRTGERMSVPRSFEQYLYARHVGPDDQDRDN
jgi:hypothetical protein